MITRKELAKAAKRTLKKHFWILVVVCLIAAFVGSEFTETFSFFKMQMTDINNTDTNESQGVTLVTSDIDNRTKSAMLDAIVSVIMNNEEQGKEQSQTLIDKAKDNAGDILGRTSGILSSVVNNVSSGAVVFTIVDVVYGITGSRHLVVILLLCLALIFYFGIRYVVKMSYVVISRRIFLESRTYKSVGVGKFMFLMRVKSEQSKDAVANIQAVTENVNKAVGNLTSDSNRLLDFVDTDIVECLNGFEKMADDYNMDASNINDLVSDFSATSEELVASISNITQAIDGITSASNDSATGTTNIAQKTIVIVKGSEAVMNGAKTAEASAAELRKNVNNFVID